MMLISVIVAASISHSASRFQLFNPCVGTAFGCAAESRFISKRKLRTHNGLPESSRSGKKHAGEADH
jgi:hypothetical protein